MSEIDFVAGFSGGQALVVGGGGSALGPVAHLLAEGAQVAVVAPQIEAALEDLVARGIILWHQRDFIPSDLDGVSVVVAASGDTSLDEIVRGQARERGVLTLHRASHAARVATPGQGQVILVGGGPGDPGLLTVRGLREVQAADVVVVDRLAPLAVLDELGTEVEIIDVSKIPRGRHTTQEEINAVLIERARQGHRVVRLKGGDPYVFGRGMEEVMACREAGVAVEVVPGVTSAVAGPELAGIPVTHRGLVQGFAVVSGHCAPNDPRSTIDWAHLAASGVTIVILMGVETLPEIARALLAGGRVTQTPVASIMNAATTSQRVIRTTLGALAEAAPDGLIPPAVTVVGDVAAFAEDGIAPRVEA
ncbi:uroporphyrinogen-III C-methyltransferase [Gephyromycinifex aptenodytis]|uniref:uroporphyrinogen-III C-methyltransferase n=1 Tax=Gephyromycinifex aptenodytis TaxID=2716227 RepID=UPI001447DAE0|nr:uroporphyrinogen-III C-methyltransferase [Gephyromycinifex aptenodytis]